MVLAIRLGTCAALLGVAGPALASSQDLYGFGARGPAMAGATTALCAGWESIWYNPAGLVADRLRTFAFGYQAGIPRLDVAGGALGDVDPADLEPTGGVVIGASLPLPIPAPIDDRVFLGMGLYIPDTVLIAADVPAPYEPRFAVLGARANTLAVQLGGAFRITDWLSAGAGVRVIASLVGSIDVAPNVFGRLGSKVSDELLAEYSLHAGVLVGPLWGLRLGVAYRAEQRADFSVPLTAELGNTFPLDVPRMNIEGTAQFDPHQVAVGLSYDPAPWLSAEVGVLWRQWSAYPLPVENTTPSVAPQPPPGFVDTWSPRVGVEGRVEIDASWAVLARGGYLYEPTPVPEQRGSNNYLDNDRHGWSLGVGGRFGLQADDGTEDLVLRADLYVQHQLLVERTNTKRDPAGAAEAAALGGNLGFPSITTSGDLISAGGALTVGF